MNYYYSKKVKGNFDETVAKLRSVLQPEGFGVVTEMDVREKFKEKLNVDFRPYLILGTCNPNFAYQALKEEDKLGTMLPCNFMVQQLSENESEVAAINPEVAMKTVNNPNLDKFASEVSSILKRVLNKM